MRILYVQDTDWIRRNPIHHTHLSERLSLRGHEIRAIDYEILWRSESKGEFLSKRRVIDVARVVDGAKVTVIRPGILKVPVLDYVSMVFTYGPEIHKQVSQFRPDVVIGNDILTTIMAWKAARSRNIPVVFFALDIEYKLVPFGFLQPLAKLIEKHNIRTADIVIAINEKLREYTIAMGAKPDKTLVLKTGFDPQKFDPNTDGTEIRNKYGIAPTDIVLLFVGWLYDFSGLKEVALEIAKRSDGRVKFLVVGDGDAYAEMCRIRDSGLGDRVIVTGRQPYETVCKFIAASDVCLLPAHNNEIMRDIVPIKMYDYMAMKKPVVATRLPGLVKEFGQDNGVVYVDRPEDAVATAVGIAESGVGVSLGRKSREFVETHNWDAVTDEFERILEHVVRAKKEGNAAVTPADK